MNDFVRRVLFLPPQASTVAAGLDQLHFVVIGTTMCGALLVAIVAAYFMIRYRRVAPVELGTAPAPLPARAKRALPFGFEVFSAALLLSLFLAFWIVGYGQFVRLQSPPKDALPIQVIAKQWMWSFAYDNGSGSKAVLYVPTHRPVKLSMTSRDVIHSFYIPAFRVKKDVVPGRTTELWFEAKESGSYPVYCAEYCGEGHSTMRATVVALSDEDYARAVEQLPPIDLGGPVYREPGLPSQVPAPGLSLAAMGERVATEKGCMRCHTVDGTAHIGPTWAGLYGSTVPLKGGGDVLADTQYLTESMMDPRAKIHLGYPPVMPSYQGALTAAETGAVLEYLRALALRKPSLASQPLPPAGIPGVRLPDVDHPAGEGAPALRGSQPTPEPEPMENPAEDRR
ncbi:MAG TPA: cytochrome c oxidase subunit II [Polyangiaceae bacterium]|nr:cytochrome c oxidase subunit II [Polyangiaceae bacterium]